MAYADARTTNRKLGAGAVVLLLEAGLAYAVVTGLAYKFGPRQTPRNPTTIDVPLPEEPKPVPPPPRPAHPTAPTPPNTHPIVSLPPTPIPNFPDQTVDKGPVELPPIAKPEPPRFVPKAARPKGSTANWISDSDYPGQGIRLGHEGKVGYRLGIDPSGRVTDCTITRSSGFAELDKTACDVLARRARFEPATGPNGEPGPGSFSGSVIWRLPPEN